MRTRSSSPTTACADTSESSSLSRVASSEQATAPRATTVASANANGLTRHTRSASPWAVVLVTGLKTLRHLLRADRPVAPAGAAGPGAAHAGVRVPANGDARTRHRPILPSESSHYPPPQGWMALSLPLPRALWPALPPAYSHVRAVRWTRRPYCPSEPLIILQPGARVSSQALREDIHPGLVPRLARGLAVAERGPVH